MITGNSGEWDAFALTPPRSHGWGMEIYTPSLRLPMIDIDEINEAAHYSDQAYSDLVRSFGYRYAWKFKTWLSNTFYWLDAEKNYLIFKAPIWCFFLT